MWPHLGTLRTESALKRVVFEIINSHWMSRWCKWTLSQDSSPFYINTTSSGSSFEETVNWLRLSVPLVPFPLVSSSRSGDAFGLRVLSLGGIGALVDNRNLRLTRALKQCPLCHTTTGFTRREDGTWCITLVHVLSYCRRKELVAARQKAHEDVMNMEELENHAGCDRERLFLNHFKEMLNYEHREQRPPVMFFLSLGVPIPPFSSASGDPSLPLPTPPHVLPRRLWYGKHDEGAMKRMSKKIQAHVMRATADHVVLSLSTLQRRVWAMQGARAPGREKQRLAELERQRNLQRRKEESERFVAYFRR